MKTQTITVAKFIGQQIERSERLQEDIATDCGFVNPNMISMIKNGVTKLPLAKIGVLAKALDIEPAYLLRLAMLEYMCYDPRKFRSIDPSYSRVRQRRFGRNLRECRHLPRLNEIFSYLIIESGTSLMSRDALGSIPKAQSAPRWLRGRPAAPTAICKHVPPTPRQGSAAPGCARP